jgi:hypothetical protein
MRRYAYGVSLSASERQGVSVRSAPPTRGTTPAIKEHTCYVTLPDGRRCNVEYKRTSASSHLFTFGLPVDQRRRVNQELTGVPAIEAKAQELAEVVFQSVQENEVRQMRRKGAPLKTAMGDDERILLSPKTAAELAGRYAVCVRFADGRLMRIGTSYPAPQYAVSELRSGAFADAKLSKGQAIVIGICNRAARRFQEPKFLAERPTIQAPEEVE